MHKTYDVLVVGAGHAGLEAACASYRLGAKTALITLNPENLGELSCNPSIGGVGKGTVVREIDALGGIMGVLGDKSSINYRVLNKTKGPAAWGWRCQADRLLYKDALKNLLEERYSGMEVIIDSVDEVLTKNNSIYGLVLKTKGVLLSKSVVIATGTFLNGTLHVGLTSCPGGRSGELASNSIVKSLTEIGFSFSRLRTGTPPRLLKNTICFDGLTEQKSDIKPLFFSTETQQVYNNQLSCYITHTNHNSHQILLENQEQVGSWLTGGVGPRYCPSIETKVKNFPEKTSHQVFLEPEGLKSDLIYPGGISISISEKEQELFLRSIKGLESVQMQRCGYSVGYDFSDPVGLFPTMETKLVKNLFFAGQINGTTGYEEAAGQGLVAGVNAALKCFGQEDFVLDRSNSYIGVMTDDLVLTGVGGEPYRLFTARSENRLSVRGDNAITRLYDLAKKYNLLDIKRSVAITNRQNQKTNFAEHILNRKFIVKNPTENPFILSKEGKECSLTDIFASGVSFDEACLAIPEFEEIVSQYPQDVAVEVSADMLYSNYINRQLRWKNKLNDLEYYKIPLDFDYSTICGLSNEEFEKLSKIKPPNLHMASRIPGITPASIVFIIQALLAQQKKKKQ